MLKLFWPAKISELLKMGQERNDMVKRGNSILHTDTPSWQDISLGAMNYTELQARAGDVKSTENFSLGQRVRAHTGAGGGRRCPLTFPVTATSSRDGYGVFFVRVNARAQRKGKERKTAKQTEKGTEGQREREKSEGKRRKEEAGGRGRRRASLQRRR